MTQLDPIFLDEARDNLDRMECALLSAGKPDANPYLVDSIYRWAHSIKGGAASFGLAILADLMHASESVLARWRQDRVAPDAICLGLLVDAVVLARSQLVGDTLSNAPATELTQRLRPLGKSVGHGMAKRLMQIVVEPPHRRDLVAAVTGMFQDIAGLGDLVDVAGIDEERKVFRIRSDAPEGELLDLLAMHVDRDLVTISEPVAASGTLSTEDAGRVDLSLGVASVRVPTHELDQIRAMSQHVVESGDRLRHLSQMLVSKTNADNVFMLDAELAKLQQLAVHLREAVDNVRVAPLSEIFDIVARLIRHMSITLGKEFILDMSGHAIRIERTMLQALVDPIGHIVRNCCAHGIEPAFERRALGKPLAGHIHLDAQRLDNLIRIAVRDDGCGLSRNNLLRAARSGDLDVSDDMPDKDVWQLVFVPGISTAMTVTQIAGRGIGMDAVRSNIAALGGSVTIDSSPGAGTTVTIDLPLGVSA